MVLFWEMGAKRPYLTPLITYLWFKRVGNGCMLRHGWRPFFSLHLTLSFMIPFLHWEIPWRGLVDSPFFFLESQRAACLPDLLCFRFLV